MRRGLEFKTVPLKRNGTGYLIGNFVYIKDRLEGGNLFLRCQKYKTCPARGVIVGSHALDCHDLRHNHSPPDVLAMIFRNSLVQMAMDPSNMCLTSKDVYSKGVSMFKKDGLSDETRLPPFREVRWAIKANRIKKVKGWKVYVNKKKMDETKDSKSDEQEPSTSSTQDNMDHKPHENMSKLPQTPLPPMTSVHSQIQQQQQQQQQPAMNIANPMLQQHHQQQQQQQQPQVSIHGNTALIQAAHQQLCGVPTTSHPGSSLLPSTGSLLPGVPMPVGLPGGHLPSSAVMEGNAIIRDFLLVS